jgi:hypothetical protein
MKYITKLKLAAVHLVCDVEDKSTEYMIQFMQDVCKVNLDCVMNYLQLSEEEHTKLKDEVADFTVTVTQIESLYS